MYKLSRVVKEFMIEDLGVEQIDRRYPRFLSMAISGLRDLYYDSIGSTEKEVVIEVNDNDTVDLPDDFIDYYAVGVCNGGELIGLGLNTNLCDVAFDSCGNRQTDTNTTTSADLGGSFINYHSYNDKGEVLGGSFGVGGGVSNIGEYKFYPDKGYMIVSGFSGGSVVLRYKSDISMANGDFDVHPYNVEAIKAWMWNKYVSKSRSYGLGDKQISLQNYKRAKRLAQRQHLKFSVREFLQAWKSGFRGSPRI